MADTLRTLRAPGRASALPASSGAPLSIAMLQTLATSALQDSLALLDAPTVSARNLERALVKATRAATALKRARAAQIEGAAA